MEESTGAVELALEGHSLFISGQKYNFNQSVASDLEIIDRFSFASCCVDFFKTSAPEKTNRWEAF